MSTRLRDYVIYGAVGLAFFTLLFWLVDQENMTRQIFDRWGGLVLETVSVIGLTLRDHRRHLQGFTLWLVLGLWLCAHTGVAVSILRSVDEWKALWWMLIFPVEYIGLTALLARLVKAPRGKHL